MSIYPKAVIVWLDECIGLSNHYCNTLKRAFLSTLDPEWSDLKYRNDISIVNDIKADFGTDSCSYKSSAIEMYAFHNATACTHCFQENEDKQIFFIVSNPLAEHFVPPIAKKYLEIFQKAGEDQCSLVYVFHSSSKKAVKWPIDCEGYVQMFGSETTLLAQLTRNVGEYFAILGQKQYDYNTLASLRQALKYFDWAKELFLRANYVEKSVLSNSRERDVDSQIVSTETLLQQITIHDDDFYHYIPCGETDSRSDVDMAKFNQQEKLNSSSSSFQSEVTNVESSLFPTESDSTMSSDYIGEKPSEQMEELVNIQENRLDIGVFLLLPSVVTEKFKTIWSILKELFDANLKIVREGQDLLKLLKPFDSQMIAVLSSNDDDKWILEKLCSLSQPPSIYLLGSQPNTANEKQVFFKKYYSVCAMLYDPEELAVKVAIDVAMKCRMMGDRYARNNDKDRASKMYDQCIKLLNRLNCLAQKNAKNGE